MNCWQNYEKVLSWEKECLAFGSDSNLRSNHHLSRLQCLGIADELRQRLELSISIPENDILSFGK